MRALLCFKGEAPWELSNYRGAIGSKIQESIIWGKTLLLFLLLPFSSSSSSSSYYHAYVSGGGLAWLWHLNCTVSPSVNRPTQQTMVYLSMAHFLQYVWIFWEYCLLYPSPINISPHFQSFKSKYTTHFAGVFNTVQIRNTMLNIWEHWSGYKLDKRRFLAGLVWKWSEKELSDHGIWTIIHTLPTCHQCLSHKISVKVIL